MLDRHAAQKSVPRASQPPQRGGYTRSSSRLHAYDRASLPCCTLKASEIKVGYRFDYMRWPVREALHLLAVGDARQHQNGFQAALQAHDDVSVHTVTDHYGVLRVGIYHAQGRS